MTPEQERQFQRLREAGQEVSDRVSHRNHLRSSARWKLEGSETVYIYPVGYDAAQEEVEKAIEMFKNESARFIGMMQ